MKNWLKPSCDETIGIYVLPRVVSEISHTRAQLRQNFCFYHPTIGSLGVWYKDLGRSRLYRKVEFLP